MGPRGIGYSSASAIRWVPGDFMRRAICVVASSALALSALVASLQVSAAPATPVKAGEWVTHGRDASEQRFSPLKQVTADNVSQLGLAWYADFTERGGWQSTPLIVDGRIYVTTPWSKVYAFDAARPASCCGSTIRTCRAKSPPPACAATSPTAAWRTGTARSSGATLDGRLVAVNAKNRQEGLGSAGHRSRRWPIPSPARRASATASCSSAKAAVGVPPARLPGGPRRRDRQGSCGGSSRAGQSGQGSRQRGLRQRDADGRQDLERRMVEDRRRRHRLGRHRLRPADRLGDLRHRQRHAVAGGAALAGRRRQPVHRVHRCAGCEDRQVQVALPDHADGRFRFRQHLAADGGGHRPSTARRSTW